MPLIGPDLLSLCLSGALQATPQNLWRAWSLAPQVAAPLALLPVAYLSGRALRPSGPGGEESLRPWCFFAGWLALCVALLSPLCRLSATLVSGHMAQLMLLAGVGPALLALGRPGRTIAPLLPRSLGLRSVRWGRGGFIWSRAWAYGAALWLWHYPPIYEFALSDPLGHLLGVLMLVSFSCLFWSAVMHTAAGEAGRAILVLLATMTHMGLLGAILTFARTPFYGAQAAGAALWGLTPLEDQQLAGLLMWIPFGLLYVGVALALGAAWLRRQEARSAPERA